MIETRSESEILRVIRRLSSRSVWEDAEATETPRRGRFITAGGGRPAQRRAELEDAYPRFFTAPDIEHAFIPTTGNLRPLTGRWDLSPTQPAVALPRPVRWSVADRLPGDSAYSFSNQVTITIAGDYLGNDVVMA